MVQDRFFLGTGADRAESRLKLFARVAVCRGSGLRTGVDRETGRFRGFGFVEMNDNDAREAVQALNGKEVGGRALKVNEAQERESRPPRY